MEETPTIEFIGHATFVLKARSAKTLVIDAYPPNVFGGALGLDTETRRFDLAVSSHDHPDHAGAGQWPGPPDLVTSGTFGPFHVDRFRSDHDEYDGRRRAGHVDLLAIRFDDHLIVHASDIGRSPSPSTIEAVREADVFLVPVGGFYTVGAAQAWEWCLRCSPRTIVPMHYKTPASSLGIRERHPFLSVATWPVERRDSKLDLDDLGRTRRVVTMEPSRATRIS